MPGVTRPTGKGWVNGGTCCTEAVGATSWDGLWLGRYVGFTGFDLWEGRPVGPSLQGREGCRWSRIMALRAPTPEATIPHRRHPFLSTRRARPLSRSVSLPLPEPLSTTPEPPRAAKSTVMTNPNILHGVMHPNHFPMNEIITSISFISSPRFPKSSCRQIPCELWCAHPTPS